MQEIFTERLVFFFARRACGEYAKPGVYYLTSVYAGDIINRIISKSGGIGRPLGKEQENVTLSRFYHPDIGCSDHLSLQFSDDAAISAGAGYPPAEPRAAHWAADGLRVAVSGLPQDVRHALALCREPGVSGTARGHGAGLRALFGGEPPARAPAASGSAQP